VIVLAGGFSTRLGQDKGLLMLKGKPLVEHVLDATKNLVEETILVVSSRDQAERYHSILKGNVKVLSDANAHGPLVGASVGFENASGKYSLLLPCDTPLVSRKILSLLLDLCINKTAAIPRWPNFQIEPLQAVYLTAAAFQAGKESLVEGKADLRSMIDKLHGVRYVSTLVIQQLDPEFKTFMNVNTIMDLRKAETMLQHSVRKPIHYPPDLP
jgi:molybdopterin-guanine dinucleotide biosynthesis protein A